MADKTISALTAASLPLGGTEVLPIVQGTPATTVKVAVDNLTVKNIRSNSTTGLMQMIGAAAGSTRVMTIPDANFTVARTDAAQSFTGDQTLSTGNLIQGTAGKGFSFAANTHASGVTSSLLSAYEEGTWTPTQGAGLTVVGTFSSSGTYTRIGRMVIILGSLNGSTSVACSAGGALTAGLPFTPAGSIGGGTAINSNLDGSSVLYVTSTIYTGESVKAASAIVFSGIYFV